MTRSSFFLPVLLLSTALFGSGIVKAGFISCDTTKTVRCTDVYPSGYKRTDYRYRNGLRHGIWLEFSEDGKVIRKTKYRNGRRLWEFRYANNRVIESINRKGVVKKVKDCGC